MITVRIYDEPDDVSDYSDYHHIQSILGLDDGYGMLEAIDSDGWYANGYQLLTSLPAEVCQHISDILGVDVNDKYQQVDEEVLINYLCPLRNVIGEVAA